MGERAERWKRRIENSRYGDWWMGVASFLESIVVPIPLEIVLIPYLVVRRSRVWRIATIVTVGCLIGALVGYSVGYFAIETVGPILFERMGWSEHFEQFRSTFEEHGFWAIVGIGIVPVPFQVAMLVAGAASYPILLFILAAVLARGIRYYGLAVLVATFGDRTEDLWKEHSTSVLLGVGGLCAIALWLSWSG